MRFLVITLFVLSLISCNKSEDNEKVIIQADSIAMGAQYVNDIYYSFENGIVGNPVPRNNWTIGFKTNGRSSSIIVNSTLGIKLWQSAADTNNWAQALDTTDLKLTSKQLLDSDTTWSLSAFEQNQTAHPDYGWGEYNSITHDVVGNHIFVIQLVDKSFKKIWIRKRAAGTNTYKFSFANIDGTSSTDASINCGNYLTKNFVYYNIPTKEIVDREPAQADWDVVLTKYYEKVYNSSTQQYEPYSVTGFLQNETVTAAEVIGDLTSNSYAGQKFLTSISIIGSDWKVIDMNANPPAYALKPDTKYFIQTRNKTIYKLVFKKFEGSSTGKVVFEKTKLK